MALTKEKTIELHEYQYLNLIKDNILCSVETKAGSTIEKISSTDWQPIRYFSYKESKDSDLKSEDEVKIGDYTWEMKSGLQLNVGPSLVQTLHSNDLITVYSTTNIDDNGNPTSTSN